ncbi:hypothetical protein AB205_0083070 [Aquarana catesbeiana]|uniref:DNA-directed RNA polymerases I and III subunit RPAC2 n=1 Tax=Aquarana catesbeiana TaxID=8400 RepID=A0A2G9SHI1_AQUCT|nr:hypothetical protein AB205_0083070 [Aquarana catesbeiana]
MEWKDDGWIVYLFILFPSGTYVALHRLYITSWVFSLKIQANGMDESCVTFVLHEEDHTLGNGLRYMVMKNPEVEFCGYSITHPSESKINFRIQTRNEIPAVEPFRKGLTELMEVCQHVLDTFETSMKNYNDQKETTME